MRVAMYGLGVAKTQDDIVVDEKHGKAGERQKTHYKRGRQRRTDESKTVKKQTL